MALVLNEDQQLLKESACGFFADKSPISAFRALRDQNSEIGFSADLWREMIDMGFTSMILPEEEGGTGFGYVGAGIVSEAMASTLVASPFFSSSIIGLELLKSVNSDLVSVVGAGEKLATFAVDASGHFNLDQHGVKAEQKDGDWYLTGLKTFVPDGHVADYILVSADIGGSTGLFLVERYCAHLIADRIQMADSRNWAKLTFEGAAAKPLALDAKEIINTALDKATAIVAAELLGLTQAAFDMTVGYLKERKQFGQVIGSFQALQHRAAHLYSEIEVTRSMVLAALQAVDTGAENMSLLVSGAKARACKTAELMTNEAIQMHGGIGMTDEYDIGFFIKRARALQNLYGGYHYHCDQFAMKSGY